MAVSNVGVGGGFQVSPGVNVSEIDLTTTVPGVSTTEAGIAGVFRWGPAEQIVLVDSENTLANVYGKPTDLNAETWFTAANFLSYGNKLSVVRSSSSNTYNAVANTGAANVAALIVKNVTDFNDKQTTLVADTTTQYIAKYPGDLGNSLKIATCETAAQYSSSFTASMSISIGSANIALTMVNTGILTTSINVGDIVDLGNDVIGHQKTKVSSINIGNTTHATIVLNDTFKLSTDLTANTVTRYWEYYSQVDGAPGQSEYVTSNGNTAANDELHVVIVDKNGKFTGAPGQILEVYQGVSRATDAKNYDGTSNFYKTVINNGSAYAWATADRSGATSATALLVASATSTSPLSLTFQGGTDGGGESDAPFADIARAYDLFRQTEEVDISLILTGKSRGGTNGEQLPNYLIDNVAEYRKDCVVFLSPAKTDVVNVNINTAASNIVTFRNSVRSSSYAFMDSGYKYQYDKYNDVNRYIPLNGDIAGLVVRTDTTNDPWWSPAGYARGQIKNIIKLAFNPTKVDRDNLYKSGVNPVVTFPGQGTILYGDKTLLAKPSAFDRINVRRLFIVLEKAISNASKSTLFEFNDEFTRLQFKNMVEPYLRDVKGRRGVTDFKVVCDATNNTAEVVDSNRFVGDIYIKPARSINYIQLNFVAVRTGVAFSEIVN